MSVGALSQNGVLRLKLPSRSVSEEAFLVSDGMEALGMVGHGHIVH